MSLRFNELPVEVLTGTTHATPGTRTNHAHGLQYAPSANRILIVPKAADNDTNNAGAVSLVSVDGTNIAVKGSAASLNFTAFVFLGDNEARKAEPTAA